MSKSAGGTARTQTQAAKNSPKPASRPPALTIKPALESRQGKLYRLAPRLNSNPGTLKSLIDHARELDGLRRRMQFALPDEMRGRWHLARLDEEEMVLVAQSGGWATRLRYLSRLLQDTAQRIGAPRPHRVSIRVARESKRRSTLQPPGPISDQASRTLQRAASATADPRLRAAFERLASRR
ncbi:Zn-ribbon-containing [Halorhodospira halochloris]|uniref:Zn-ribbon-containing n=1 Tax=Halorhodospira halochloris TaxID=1052 RepID=A0A0X8XAQ3_HALHR|nr:DciA family protein [Halorhodospira halochloris]MBK1652138.1 hypothetical protein [Halorhodospira halochloris]BAU58444.1 Zn-ribbon-containing [Halorhodospira halochloris]